MFSFVKHLSRSVHDEGYPLSHRLAEIKPSDGDEEGGDQRTTLTVWRKSLLMSCYGFTVIDSSGDLVYRVDDYAGGKLDDVVLMDREGKSVVTMHRNKKLAFPDSWMVYEGDMEDHCHDDNHCLQHHLQKMKMRKKKPVWCVKRHPRMLTSTTGILAYVYSEPYDKKYAYVIEGCYGRRSCKVLDGSHRVVAEIKRKENDVVGCFFGLDVFILVVNFGFDPGFAMALVLLLDQLFPDS